MALTLTSLVKEIVKRAKSLKDLHTREAGAPVNYAAVFSQTDDEYRLFLEAANKAGKIIQNTQTGPLFLMPEIKTVAGPLKLVKVRAPDPTRPERGDADFTVGDYPKFKEECLAKPQFKLIKREDYEMIELMDQSFNVRAYFSYPTIGKILNVE